MQVAGARVLLTGANGGIGRAFVDELLQRGAAKVYLGVRTVNGHSFPDDPRLEVIQLDVADTASILAAAKKASDVNVLINNAGFAAFTGGVAAPGIDAARREMDVNYFGPLQLTRALKNSPVFSAAGAIVNVISFLALATLPAGGTYSASKSAALALTRTFRAELKAKGTRVIAVLPVQVDTPMGAALPEPKVKPAEVAAEALDALETGLEEVFPGQPSKEAAPASRLIPPRCRRGFRNSFTRSREGCANYPPGTKEIYPPTQRRNDHEQDSLDHRRLIGHRAGDGAVHGQEGLPRFCTVRKETLSLDGVELVKLDVTDDASVNEAVRTITAKAGPIGGLVNNAGYLLNGAIEETGLAEAREQFETNFFGVLRTVNAVLPGMRGQGYGRIVNVSSVLGFMPAPYAGLYVASKHAIEGYTETLDHEVRQFGVRAVLVEPDFTRTSIDHNGRAVARTSALRRAESARNGGRPAKRENRHRPARGCRRHSYGVDRGLTPAALSVGGGGKLSLLRRYVPAGMFASSIRKQFRMDEAQAV